MQSRSGPNHGGQVKNRSAKARRPDSIGTDPVLRDIESRLQRLLGTRVKIVGTSESGHFEIAYFNRDDLDRLIRQFGFNE
jgi:hypothetical protein